MLFWQLSSEKNYSRKMTTTELKNVVLSLFQFLGKNVPSAAVVDSDTKSSQFESSHWQNFIYWTFIYCQLYWKDENKEKSGRERPVFKKNVDTFIHSTVLIFLNKCYLEDRSETQTAFVYTEIDS